MILTHEEILEKIAGRNSPIAEPWRNHIWEERTGRLYFYSHDVDNIERGWHISVNGLIFIAYTLQLPTGWENGRQTYGDPIDFWEYVPKPWNPNNVKMKF